MPINGAFRAWVEIFDKADVDNGRRATEYLVQATGNETRCYLQAVDGYYCSLRWRCSEPRDYAVRAYKEGELIAELPWSLQLSKSMYGCVNGRKVRMEGQNEDEDWFMQIRRLVKPESEMASEDESVDYGSLQIDFYSCEHLNQSDPGWQKRQQQAFKAEFAKRKGKTSTYATDTNTGHSESNPASTLQSDGKAIQTHSIEQAHRDGLILGRAPILGVGANDLAGPIVTETSQLFARFHFHFTTGQHIETLSGGTVHVPVFKPSQNKRGKSVRKIRAVERDPSASVPIRSERSPATTLEYVDAEELDELESSDYSDDDDIVILNSGTNERP